VPRVVRLGFDLIPQLIDVRSEVVHSVFVGWAERGGQ
jgi:hypothetical protein